MNRHDTSLDGLLSGLGGVEGSVLKAKRQTMASVGGKMGGSAVAKRGGEVAVGAGEEEGEVAEGSGRAGTVSSSGGGIERGFSPVYLDVEQLLGVDGGGLDGGLDGGLPGVAGDLAEDVDKDEDEDVDVFLAGIYGEGGGEVDDVGLREGHSGGFAQYRYPGQDTEGDVGEENVERLFTREENEDAHGRQSPSQSPSVRSPRSAGSAESPINAGVNPPFKSPPRSPGSSWSGYTHDVGHKAAKGLQSAKNWLFSASKTIARDVQSRIEAHKERGGGGGGGGELHPAHRRRPSIIDSPLSDFVPEAHHQMWAQQLVHAEPETQAAAMEAMEAYDRMAVQQVIDELVWYEAKERRERGVGGGEDAGAGGGVGDVLHPARPAPPAPVEESFDLLHLDGSPGGRVDDDGGALTASTGAPRPLRTAPPPTTPPTTTPIPTPTPPPREQLKASRVAREQKRVDEKVASARDQASRDAAEKQEKVAIRERLRPEIDAWTSNKKDNIRSLLCTMDAVMWSKSNWTSPSVVDVMEPGQVRKWYMKANLVVHPDKVKQRHGSLEELARAEMIFDALKSAWGKFQ